MGAREIKAKITNPTVYVKYNPTLVDYIDLVYKLFFQLNKFRILIFMIILTYMINIYIKLKQKLMFFFL